jgi:hypothetical protein
VQNYILYLIQVSLLFKSSKRPNIEISIILDLNRTSNRYDWHVMVHCCFDFNCILLCFLLFKPLKSPDLNKFIYIKYKTYYNSNWSRLAEVCWKLFHSCGLYQRTSLRLVLWLHPNCGIIFNTLRQEGINSLNKRVLVQILGHITHPVISDIRRVVCTCPMSMSTWLMIRPHICTITYYYIVLMWIEERYILPLLDYLVFQIIFLLRTGAENALWLYHCLAI